jgi:hypothetical protein
VARRRTVVVALLGAVVVLGLGGGGCEPPPPAKPRPTGSAPGGASAKVRPGDRHSRLDVPAGLVPHSMQFADAHTGYVLFAGCGTRCRAALFVTFDGGQSWLERDLPVTVADGFQLEVLDRDTPVLTTDSTGWYVSHDAGRSFTHAQRLPPEVKRASWVQVRCPDDDACPPQVLRDGVALAAQPRLPGHLRSAALGGDGRIWVVSVADTVLHAAVSPDGGRTWQPYGQPLPAAGTESIQMTVSPDGRDVWLLAGSADRSVTVFYAAETVWITVLAGFSLGPDPIAAAAAGGGALAMAGTEFAFVHRDGRRTGDRPRRVSWLGVLPDGTLVGSSGPAGTWLGVGAGPNRTWAHVTVEPA